MPAPGPSSASAPTCRSAWPRESLDELPKQLLLDQARRRLFVTLPGANQVAALDADTLQPLQRARLPGGPLLAAALDAVGGRLYALSAASADYRTLAVLDASDLSRLALVAGTPAVPLRQASALASRRGRPAVGGRGQPPVWHCAGRLPAGRRRVARVAAEDRLRWPPIPSAAARCGLTHRACGSTISD